MEKKKTLLCVGLALLMICLNLTGCANGASVDDTYVSGGQASNGMMLPQEGGWTEDSSAEVSEPVADNDAEEAIPRDKLIYRADMDLETTAFDQTAQRLEEVVEELGGYFESRSVSQYGTYRHGSYTVRVPAENFQRLLELVGESAHVLSQNDYADNVSESYYDLEARLATQRTKLERLQELLAKAETMEDIITVESAISETELQIEYLTGSLRTYDSLIDYSTVEISLSEVYKLSNVEEPAVGFGDRLVKALSSGLYTGINAVESLILALAYSWFFLLPPILVVVVLVLVLRRNRRKAEKQPPQPPAEKP